jgi:acid stress-induced BolA-like protein IbaG/YrbA
LTRRLRLKDPQFVLERAGNMVFGSVISKTFKRKDDLKRQHMIWDALEAEFGTKATGMVGSLLAYTPEEWNLDPYEVRPRAAGNGKRA